MLRLSSSLVVIVVAVVVIAATGCPPVVAEGEGEAPAGEGEGEGEEGEGEEGEGEGEEGEGEGEGGQGEGEGEEGEGEGEGEGGEGAGVFGVGALDVVVEAAVGAGDLPLRIVRPTAAGDYPALVFQHGFLMDTAWYSTLLAHVASHGVIVVAAQMYDADNIPFGKPSASEEAAAAADVIDGLSLIDTGAARFDGRVFGAGHSRGGKVLWKVLTANPTALDGVVLLDPVDGTQGGGRVVDDTVDHALPTVIVGTERGPEDDGGFFSQPCAPAGDNHVEFSGDAPASALHLVARATGHNDLLDDEQPGCGVCDVCLVGDDVGATRATFAGLIVAAIAGSAAANVATAPVVLEAR